VLPEKKTAEDMTKFYSNNWWKLAEDDWESQLRFELEE